MNHILEALHIFLLHGICFNIGLFLRIIILGGDIETNYGPKHSFLKFVIGI